MDSMNRRNDYSKKNVSMFVQASDCCFKKDMIHCESIL